MKAYEFESVKETRRQVHSNFAFFREMSRTEPHPSLPFLQALLDDLVEEKNPPVQVLPALELVIRVLQKISAQHQKAAEFTSLTNHFVTNVRQLMHSTRAAEMSEYYSNARNLALEIAALSAEYSLPE